MSEQEYLEMIVAERIQMILADMEGGAVMDGEEEWEKTLDGLEEAQRKAIEGYLDQTVFRQAATEKHLYLAGLKDGIRLEGGIPCGPFLFTCGKERGRSQNDHDPYYHHSYFPVAGNRGLRRRMPEQIGFIFRHEEGSDGTEKDQTAPAR